MHKKSIELHPNAIKNFNERGDKLISELREIRKPIHQEEEIEPFKPEVYVHATITEKDIISDLGTSKMGAAERNKVIEP